MAGRVFDSGLACADRYGWRFWYEIAEDRFVLGSSWKEVSLYLGTFVNRDARIRTQRLAEIMHEWPDTIPAMHSGV